jgi:hypothetical protein
MDKDEALRLALEAFNDLAAWNDGEVGSHMDEPYSAEIAKEAITAIKAALEAKDEPEINLDHVICPNCVHQFRAIPKNVQRLMLDASFEPPFTTPPQRTWVGLTDEDDIDWEEGGNLKDLVKAIEAKLKEKNR